MILNRNPWYFPILVLFTATLAITIVSCDSDRNMDRVLRRLDLEYTVDTDGDYRVSVPTGKATEAIVGVSTHTLLLNDDVRVREIWSVAARIPGHIPENLAEDLLADTWSSRKFGSWALAGTTSDNRSVLVYLTRIPEDASKKLFHAALVDTAQSASELEQALRNLDRD